MRVPRKYTTRSEQTEAIKYAREACRQTDYREPDLLDTLSVAHAAVGDFQKAIEAVEKAIQLAAAAGKAKVVKEMQARLALYRQSKPYVPK